MGGGGGVGGGVGGGGGARIKTVIRVAKVLDRHGAGRTARSTG